MGGGSLYSEVPCRMEGEGGEAEGLYCEVPCPGVGGGPCILRFNVTFVMVTMDTPFEQNDRQTQPCHNFAGGR